MLPLALGLASAAILLAAVVVGVSRHSARRATSAAADAAASHASELAILHALGLELAAARDAEQVFAAVDRECRKLVAADEVALGLVETDASAMAVRLRGASERTPRLVSAPTPRDRRPSSSGRALVVPLVGGDEILGALSVRRVAGQTFDDRDLAALVALSAPVALAAVALRRTRDATRDPLTGLALPDAVAARLAEELARAHRHGIPVAIVMADIDRFRDLNERHGHDAGDRFLVAAAEVLRQHLRASDLAVRYGVDIFCVLLPGTGVLGANRFAERLRGAIAGLRIDADGTALGATASFGVAAHPEHGATARTLLFRADAALHRAKRAGRDRVAIASV